MKNSVLIAALFALSFATGFTCSKNAPEQTATTTSETTTSSATSATASQAQMAASADNAAVSSDSTMAQPATSTPGYTK